VFVNLYRGKRFSADFIAHNYAVFEGELHRASDPSWDVEMALCGGGVPPDSCLLLVLAFTSRPVVAMRSLASQSQIGTTRLGALGGHHEPITSVSVASGQIEKPG
jgi:hypothetical protein